MSEFEQLAREFISAHIRKEAARKCRAKAVSDCEAFEKPEWESGYRGADHCFRSASSEDDLCGPCKRAAQYHMAFKIAAREKTSLLRKMIRKAQPHE